MITKLAFDKKILFASLFIVGFYVIFMIYSDVNKMIDQFSSSNVILYLPMILAIHMFAIMIRARRQGMFLDKLGMKIPYSDNVKYQFSGFALSFTPGGAGEMIKS